MLELLRREGGQTTADRDRDGLGIVIDADGATVEVHEVASDSAADVEGEAKPQTSEVPTVWRLYIKHAFPPCPLTLREALGVLRSARALTTSGF